jgi:fructose-1,6-bisphosphatase II
LGERIGCRAKDDVKVDIAVDPLDGTSLIAKGRPNAISVVAIAPEGCLLHAPDMYMDKLAVSAKAKGAVDINAPLEDNLTNVAKALNKDISDLTVTMLDRPRHEEMIDRIRKLGARIKLFSDGDVAAAIATGFEHTGVDILMGIGGAPEGVIAAVAMKCMGGDFQGKLVPYTEEERGKVPQDGHNRYQQGALPGRPGKGRRSVFCGHRCFGRRAFKGRGVLRKRQGQNPFGNNEVGDRYHKVHRSHSPTR